MAKTDWVGVSFGLVGAAMTWLFPDYRWVGWAMLATGIAILLWHLGSWALLRMRKTPRKKVTAGEKRAAYQMEGGEGNEMRGNVAIGYENSYVVKDEKNSVVKGNVAIKTPKAEDKNQ